MQSIHLLQTTLEENASAKSFLFSLQDFYSIFPDMTIDNLRMLFSRAAKKGLLERICKGIYLYPKVEYDSSIVLYKVASKLRSSCFNYISLETVLCEASVISQQLMGWITIITTGRSGIINCGRFGTIEFVHTQKKVEHISQELTLDTRYGILRASVKQALIDMKDAKRPFDLVNMENQNE
jgi:hypothetical protein